MKFKMKSHKKINKVNNFPVNMTTKNLKNSLMKNTISDSLMKSMPLFKIVARLPKRGRDLIMKGVAKQDNPDIFKSLHEINYNILNRRINLTQSQKNKLQPYAKVVRGYCCKNNRKCSK